MGRAVLKHKVHVLVVLLEHVGDGGLNRVDVALEVLRSVGAGLGRFRPISQATVLGFAE